MSLVFKIKVFFNNYFKEFCYALMLLCLSFISVDETWISVPSNMYGLGSYTEATGYRNKTWSSQTVSFAIIVKLAQGLHT